ncbi:DNA-formamidopyrimidine glycosylase [Bacillaceae bacterium]
MPELPEVETVKRTLASLIVGKTISEVEIRLPRLIRQPDPEEFAWRLQGLTVRGIGRRGKYLLLAVPPYTLVLHLRMEGKLSLHEQGEPYEKHVHLVFRFTDGSELRYKDVRTFGTFDLIPEGDWERVSGLARLGPEPLADDFTPAVLRQRLERKTRSPIKAALLDQSVVAGLGNIYVDEALFQAGIDPRRRVETMTEEELMRLYAAIRDVLQRGIRAGGASVRSYRNGKGEMGYFQLQIAVYGRKGQPCSRCGGEIERIVVGGRGTHLCPRCQT